MDLPPPPLRQRAAEEWKFGDKGLFSGMLKKWLYGAVVAVFLAGLFPQTNAQTTLYYTQFEQAEGYDPAFTLGGQQGWEYFGTGGNGLVEEYIEGFGQQAYIGFFPPMQIEDFTSVWRPVNYEPVPAGANIVRFSVLLDFEPSTTGGQDDFRWSFYNAEGIRLFSIDFETSTTRISSLLEDEQFRDTGWTFVFDGLYDLIVWMDFARNQWTATLNDVVIINSQPITMFDSALSFGDADAVWFIRNPSAPGDNYMLFDEYMVVAEAYTEIPPSLEPLGISEEGFFQFYIHGQGGLDYAVEVTTDLENWFSLGNFTAPEGGTFLFEDTTSDQFPMGFYRVGPPL